MAPRSSPPSTFSPNPGSTISRVAPSRGQFAPWPRWRKRKLRISVTGHHRGHHLKSSLRRLSAPGVPSMAHSRPSLSKPRVQTWDAGQGIAIRIDRGEIGRVADQHFRAWPMSDRWRARSIDAAQSLANPSDSSRSSGTFQARISTALLSVLKCAFLALARPPNRLHRPAQRDLAPAVISVLLVSCWTAESIPRQPA